jgi:hypothetical protein
VSYQLLALTLLEENIMEIWHTPLINIKPVEKMLGYFSVYTEQFEGANL